MHTKKLRCFTIDYIIDKPKLDFGNTNNRITARSFFENIRKSAEITNIDPEIITKYT